MSLIDEIKNTDNTADYRHGNIVGRTTAAGEMVEEVGNKMDYDAFGNQWVGDTPNPFGYCGEYYDNESGLIYLRNRYYDSTTGRFISEDSYWNLQNMIYGDSDSKVPDISAIVQSSNLYSFCINNPINLFDLIGLRARGELISIGRGSASDIKAIQRKLKSLGYRGKDGKVLSVDGVFGTNTDYAVKNYQRKNGLSVDGIVGDNTWNSLNPNNGNIYGVYYKSNLVPVYKMTNKNYIIEGLFTIVATTPEAAQELKQLEQQEIEYMADTAIAMGTKGDIKQINQVAAKMGITGNARRAFGDYVESVKHEVGKGGNVNFTWKELVELAKEFLGQ